MSSTIYVINIVVWLFVIYIYTKFCGAKPAVYILPYQNTHFCRVPVLCRTYYNRVERGVVGMNAFMNTYTGYEIRSAPGVKQQVPLCIWNCNYHARMTFVRDNYNLENIYFVYYKFKIRFLSCKSFLSRCFLINLSFQLIRKNF